MNQLMQQLTNSNPLFARAQEMAKGKNPQEIEMIAKNLCKEKGIDFDQAFSQFKQQMNNFNGGKKPSF